MYSKQIIRSDSCHCLSQLLHRTMTLVTVKAANYSTSSVAETILKFSNDIIKSLHSYPFCQELLHFLGQHVEITFDDRDMTQLLYHDLVNFHELWCVVLHLLTKQLLNLLMSKHLFLPCMNITRWTVNLPSLHLSTALYNIQFICFQSNFIKLYMIFQQLVTWIKTLMIKFITKIEISFIVSKIYTNVNYPLFAYPMYCISLLINSTGTYQGINFPPVNFPFT